MSLASQITTLATRVGQECKSIRAESGRPVVDPADLGYKAWAFDPAPAASTGQTLTAGTLFLVRLWVRQTTVVSAVDWHVATAGATLTNVGAALYTAAGALLTSSVNANGATATAFTTTLGMKTVTFTAQTITAGSFYTAIWVTGTTVPTMSAGSPRTWINGRLISPNMRFATANTGLTTAAPANLTAQTLMGNALWAAAA